MRGYITSSQASHFALYGRTIPSVEKLARLSSQVHGRNSKLVLSIVSTVTHWKVVMIISPGAFVVIEYIYLSLRYCRRIGRG